MQVPGSDVAMTDNGAMHGNMMPFSVKYEEIPNGARLTLTPKDPAKLEEFRNIVRHHAEHMNKHDCSMMQGMMGGMKPTEPGANPNQPSRAMNLTIAPIILRGTRSEATWHPVLL